MSQENFESRTERHKNNKPNNNGLILKLAIGLLVVAGLLVLAQTFLSSDDDDQWDPLITDSSSESIDASSDQKEEESSVEKSESEESSEELDEVESKESEESEEDDVEVREVPSTDPNVIAAFTGDWKPIGTIQTGPHTTNYEDGSADRIEIKRATSQATGVPENDMIEQWIGNNGDNRVTATIEQISTGKIFKAYLDWIDGEGWQVTRFDQLKQVIR